MDISDLFLSCRRGDLARVQYLVEQKEVELNVRDKWDSTPLYYACLCGYKDLVQYMLEKGARCEANTFDGERCMYGALSSDIRHLLKNYKVTACKRDTYEEFLTRLLESGSWSDVTFEVHGTPIRAHKCILSARSDYFLDLFQGKWRDRPVVKLNNNLVRISPFRSLLQYLYTGRLEVHVDLVEDCILLANQCKVPRLKELLQDALKKVTSFECTKPGTHVTTLSIESPNGNSDLMQDLGVMAEQALPVELRSWVGGIELPLMPAVPLCFVDLIIRVDDCKFMCHKVFFCERSEYFRALLQDHFFESQFDSTHNLPVVTLRGLSAPVFIPVIYYIYQSTAPLDTSNVHEVLCVADMYLLPGLKKQCGSYLTRLLTVENVVSLLRTARIYNLPRLEDQCAEFMASCIHEMVVREEFHDVIMEDAKDVKQRQETDSIAVIDDIRYHVTCNVRTFSDTVEANEKLGYIDRLLEDLELDA